LVWANNAYLWIGRLRWCLPGRNGLQLPGQRQGLRQLDDLDRRREIDGELRRHGVVVFDVGRNELVGAAAERRHGQHQSREARFTERRKAALLARLRD